MGRLKYLLLFFVPLAIASCMDNDLSLPRDVASITAFNVVGQTSSSINSSKRTVTVVLGEEADITAVEVDSVAISTAVSYTTLPSAGDIIDMSSTLTYILSIYYDSKWTVTTTQPIERYVTCDNYISATFDVDARDLTVYVSSVQDLSAITFTSIKLEPEGWDIISTTGYNSNWEIETEEYTMPMTLNCMLQRTWTLQKDDETVEWTMSVVPQSVDVSLNTVDAWSYHVDVEGTFEGTGSPYFAYRKRGSSTWINFEDVTINGVSVSASIPGDDTVNEDAERLSPGTTYEIKMVTDEAETDVVTFTTETPDQLPNLDFDDWYQDGKVWYASSEADYLVGENIWDSANKSVATLLSYNLTTPEYDFVATDESTVAVKMISKYAVIKFAAGNLFTGEFFGIVGLSGAHMNWGTPFSSRPRGLRGYYSYSPGIVNYAENSKVTTSELDKCQVFAFITDWDEPFDINTSENIFVDQEGDENIIAYGKLETDEDSGGKYIAFDIELDYRRDYDKPTYIVVVASSSYKGDLFGGSTDSVLYVDEFELYYD